MSIERPKPQPREAVESAIEGREQREERLDNAARFFGDFVGLKSGEGVLFLSHTDPKSTDRALIEILKEACERKGIVSRELIADKKTKTEEVTKLLDDYPVVWSSCNWDATKIDFYELTESQLKAKSARMEDAAGLTTDSLNNDGMLGEKREVLHDRLQRMHEKLRDAVGFRVRTSYGTDLSIRLWPDRERQWAWMTGEVDPGEWDNPGAEIFTTPQEEGVDGVLMLPVLQDEITQEQGVDEFVKVTFRRGRIATIDGGKSAQKLRRYLEKMSKEEEDDPTSVIRCSELAFGASQYARSKVSRPELSYKHHGVSVLEAEKRMGTMHIAIGSAQHGSEGASGPTESNVHVDFVIPRNGLTVEGFDRDDDFRKGRNGRKLIDEGRWNFIE